MSLELNKHVALDLFACLRAAIQRRRSGASPRISSIMRRMIPIGLIGGSGAPPAWSPLALLESPNLVRMCQVLCALRHASSV